MMHANINSLLPKIEEISEILRETNISLLGITESKLDNSISDSEIAIEGYEIIRSDRNT